MREYKICSAKGAKRFMARFGFSEADCPSPTAVKESVQMLGRRILSGTLTCGEGVTVNPRACKCWGGRFRQAPGLSASMSRPVLFGDQ
ncbi:hypothetical protein D9M68_277930 [compost metagenome]